jgi:hypothetical protein
VVVVPRGLPIVLGAVGWLCFHLYEHFIARNPGVPSRLFGNRTSAGGYVLMFLSSVLMQTAGYFLPVYFQAVLGTTVMDSGVYFLPFAIGTLFAAAVGGVLMSHLGVYRPIHVAAFALSAVGFGLFTLLGPDTPKVAWAWYELVTVIGLGPTISTVLPAILAGLPQSDVAAATAVFSFIKTFGFVWGVSIPSIIFNGVVDDSVPAVSAADLRSQLAGGGAYALGQPGARPGPDRELCHVERGGAGVRGGFEGCLVVGRGAQHPRGVCRGHRGPPAAVDRAGDGVRAAGRRGGSSGQGQAGSRRDWIRQHVVRRVDAC